MRLLPSRKVCEKFSLTYELQGCQKAVDLLTRHYGIKRMRIVLDGKKVGNNYVAYYKNHTAYFKKKGLTKRTVLHELYHHIVNVKDLNMTLTEEERQAFLYSRNLMRKAMKTTSKLYTVSCHS